MEKLANPYGHAVIGSQEYLDTRRKKRLFGTSKYSEVAAALVNHIVLVSCLADVPKTGVVIPYWVPPSACAHDRGVLIDMISESLVNVSQISTDRTECGPRVIVCAEKSYRLTPAERDRLYRWTNFVCELPGLGVVSWGFSYYENGVFVEGFYDSLRMKVTGVTPSFLRGLVLKSRSNVI